MKKPVKKYVLPLVLTIFLVAGVFYALFAPRLILNIAQRTASSSLGSEVRMADMDFSLLRGSLNISDMSIANIEGYDAEHIMRVESVLVSFVPLSFLSDKIKFREIKIEGVALYLEQRGSNNNLLEFRSLLEPREGVGEQKNVSVERIILERIVVNVDMLVYSGSMEMDPIVLENVGTDEDMNMEQIITRIIGAAVSGAYGQFSGLIRTDAFTDEEGAARTAVDATREKGKSIIGGLMRLMPGSEDD